MRDVEGSKFNWLASWKLSCYKNCKLWLHNRVCWEVKRSFFPFPHSQSCLVDDDEKFFFLNASTSPRSIKLMKKVLQLVEIERMEEKFSLCSGIWKKSFFYSSLLFNVFNGWDVKFTFDSKGFNILDFSIC